MEYKVGALHLTVLGGTCGALRRIGIVMLLVTAGPGRIGKSYVNHYMSFAVPFRRFGSSCHFGGPR